MGTVVSFDVPLSARHDGSLAAAVRWLHWVDRVFSPYRPDSEVSKLARAEVTLDGCAPEVAEVFAASASVRDVSGGYFTASPGGRLDPSGYVKGWAVERAASLLSRAGSASHLVNGGGDVQCAGGRAAGKPWRVGIADPFRPAALALVVAVRDCAVATSGTAERGPRIIDPFTGRPPSGLASLTVVGPGLALADAYGTAAFRHGSGPGPRLDQLPGRPRGLRDHRGRRQLANPRFQPSHQPRLALSCPGHARPVAPWPHLSGCVAPWPHLSRDAGPAASNTWARWHHGTMADRQRAELGAVQQTLFIPLAARARETERRRPVLRDPKAVEMIRSIDFDEAVYGRGWGAGFVTVLRTLILDWWVRQFLAEHPAGTVVELGTGLNTRFERTDNGTAHWIDLDLLDTIELRRRFFEDTDRREMVAASLTGEGWMAAVGQRPAPYFFVSDGVLVYLDEADVTGTLTRIAGRFHGAMVAFDTYSRVTLTQQHKMAARRNIAPWAWACDDPRSLQRLGLTVVESAAITRPPAGLRAQLPARYRYLLPLAHPLFGKSPALTLFRAG